AGFSSANLARNMLLAALIGSLLGGVVRAAFRHSGRPQAEVITGALIGGLGAPLAVLLMAVDSDLGVWGFIALIAFVLMGKATGKKDEDLDFVYSPSVVAGKADKTEKLLHFLAQQDSSVEPEALRQVAQSTFLQ